MDVSRCQVVYGRGGTVWHRRSKSNESEGVQGVGTSRNETIHEGFRIIPPKNIHEHIGMNDAAISLYGPDLIEYEIKALQFGL
jgi:hypothetical protein